MATKERPAESSHREKFRTQLIKFVARILGVAVVAMTLILVGSRFTGVLQWVLVCAGVVLMIGLALYGSALSGEVRRKLGPLPLGEPDRDRQRDQHQHADADDDLAGVLADDEMVLFARADYHLNTAIATTAPTYARRNQPSIQSDSWMIPRA